MKDDRSSRWIPPYPLFNGKGGWDMAGVCGCVRVSYQIGPQRVLSSQTLDPASNPLANERLPPSLSPFEFPRPFVTFVSVFFRYAAAGKC